VSILAAAVPAEYEAPGVSDFWQPLIGSGSTAITRACFVAVISVALIAWFLLATTKKKALVPGKGQMATEAVYGLVRNGVARDLIGSKEFLRFVPLLFTFFMFILVNNLFGVLPPFQFPTMSRIGFPIGLALISWITFHVVGFRKHGFVGYWKSLVPSGLPIALIPYIFILELITDLFTRPVTLALRLFGNMFAGHLLLILFATGGAALLASGNILYGAVGILSFGLGIGVSFLEMLVMFLQAYVFTLLSSMYIGEALADEH